MKRVLILLVSEEERTALKDILKADFSITSCSNSADASQYLQQDFDALILDLFLPDVDGLTFLMQQRKQRPGVCILLTQLICEDILTRAQKLRVDVLLRKPYEMDWISNYLLQQLQKRTPPVSSEGV